MTHRRDFPQVLAALGRATILAGTVVTCQADRVGGVADATGLPVFPGAEGFGTATRAGCGGVVWRVTTLADAGPGSLREALAADGPRVVVFEVAGTIALLSDLRIAAPYVTVAGQTAPSPGITLRGAGITIATHDVLVQHLRIRVGDDSTGPDPGNRDGFQILGPDAHHVVLDHVSASWATDEVGSTYYAPHDITISNSILSEGLNVSLHPEGAHSMGLLIGEETRNLSVTRSLFAHNGDRNPYQKGGTSVLFVNNVVYNWGGSKAYSVDDPDGLGPAVATIVGNVYLPGVNSSSTRPISIYPGTASSSRIYVAENSLNRAFPPADPWMLVTNRVGPTIVADAPTLWTSPLTVLSPQAVEAWVLANAGARPADRDAVDLRIVAEVRSGSGGIIDSQAAVGGWPGGAPIARALVLPADPHADDCGDGYTNLEEWLHAHAVLVERGAS